MTNQRLNEIPGLVTSLEQLAQLADYSLLDNLHRDPQATESGEDHQPRQVFSGHYVPVKPTPIETPEYVAHSKALFRELGFDDSLALTENFGRMFSGDISQVPHPMRPLGWATGYALSIYGTEYIQQCPFQTGNGYGDGRAISVLEATINGKRWEMQLKGGGQTPYCRGADGRAVLRSSVREFLAQEHMHALGIPTSRSLCLFTSKTETVNRPWYSEGSNSHDPDTLVSDPVAITTRIASSFLRVGQLELFSRRARHKAHPQALQELDKIVSHVIAREYREEIKDELPYADKLLILAGTFRDRLTSLISHWLRVGYCQGNFNSDNCAIGGFTLDYGPFGFCERFDPFYQPWTGGGRHFSFFNQTAAAKANFDTFCSTLEPLLAPHPEALKKLHAIKEGFSSVMQTKMEQMWAAKLGLKELDSELLTQLFTLMVQTPSDFTVFFRELSNIPDNLSSLSKSFYQMPSEALRELWSQWLQNWRGKVNSADNSNDAKQNMLQINPKYTWREWLVVPAYKQAMQGNYGLIDTLQDILTRPYDEQSKEVENIYYRLRPEEYFSAGGVSALQLLILSAAA